MKNKNLSNTLKELHNLYDFINKEFYNNTLPTVIITIQSKGKTNSLGWFTPSKIWEHGEDRKHEINISAESFKEGYLEIADTLMHEMVHLYCCEKEIQDTSRGNTYHNKNFKQGCEKFGFYFKEDAYSKKYGWAFPTLKPETIEKLNNYNIDGDIFAINRTDVYSGEGEDNQKKKSNIIKWECGCGNIVRSSKDGLVIWCGECGTRFEKEGGEDIPEDMEE